MTATMFGSKGVLNYILETSCVDVNQARGLDGLLHLILFLLRTLLFQLSLKNVVDDASLWHRRIGSKMGFEERTALMTGTMFGRKA
ncbi:hypothetical protein SO802_029764 [Lithocarpus litseifolius]|uniref:Uncharacterized protein n=1 Tax=Lithocarpus litseifolius TaxID=425828 RepID=A0AAW2BU03_9ROSI